MSVRSKNFREGDRSEYLAQFLLSKLGICSPVPRQEDVGFDFHCSIFREENGLLSDLHQYIIQIKSSMDSIEYGGKFPKGGWRFQSIEWLRSLAVPFMIGVVDKEVDSIRIFSTSATQMVFFANRAPQSIILAPRKIDEGNGVFVHAPEEKDVGEILTNEINGKTISANGKEYNVDLGPPVVEFGVSDLKEIEKIKTIKNWLRMAIYWHTESIMYRNIGAPFVVWTKEITTNEKIVPGWFIGSTDDVNQGFVMERLVPLIMSIAMRAHAENDNELLRDLRPLIKRFRTNNSILEVLKENFPQIFEDDQE